MFHSSVSSFCLWISLFAFTLTSIPVFFSSHANFPLCVLVAQSCPTLCDPMDCSPPGSSVHGILQARILEWIAILFSWHRIFLTQGLTPGLLHCRQILYCLSYREVLDSNFPWSLVKSGFSKSISCFFSIEKQFFPLLLLTLLQFLTMPNIYLAGCL